MMMNLKFSELSPREVARTLWGEWSKPQWEPLTRLSFEVYALALRDESRFPGYLDDAIHEWLDFGPQALTNRFLRSEDETEYLHPCKLGVCRACGTMHRLTEQRGVCQVTALPGPSAVTAALAISAYATVTIRTARPSTISSLLLRLWCVPDRGCRDRSSRCAPHRQICSSASC